MNENSDIGEYPLTGTSDEEMLAEDRPEKVDPKVLTDDRGNKDLLVFEKTWGHRMLAGVSVAILVCVALVIVYCALQIGKVSALSGVADQLMYLGYFFYGLLIGLSVASIVPGVVGIYVAKHPKRAMVAIVFAIIALVLDVLFIAYAVASGVTNYVSLALYALLFAILPVLYLIAAVKVKRS
ncbi:MAG: hypothetical protein ACOX69_00210 [Coriobacteriales bacterium]|jgi:heme A synthase